MRRTSRKNKRRPAILIDAATKTAWNTIATTANKTLISEKYYRDKYKKGRHNESRVLDALFPVYFGKCAYCERLYKLDVEHYRPSRKVTDENNQIITHPGYYWLCYEWTNLVPACVSCNREGGKHNKFPVLGTHQITPILRLGALSMSTCLLSHSNLTVERPYLLHPEYDDPATCLGFRLTPDNKGISITGIDAQSRGTTTINICQLDRDELRLGRFQIVKGFVAAINAHFERYSRHRNTATLRTAVEGSIQGLYDQSRDPEIEHTLLRKFIVASPANFNAIVIPCIKNTAVRSATRTFFAGYIPT